MILENIKESLNLVLNKEMENLNGMMDHIIKGSMLMIRNMEKEYCMIDMSRFCRKGNGNRIGMWDEE